MKAIQIQKFGGPEVLSLNEVSTPTPIAGQVLVRVKAAGVNPVDTYIRSGIYGDRPFPFRMGMDAAGTVESVGAGVDWAKAGDRVYVTGSSIGAYAEFVLADRTQVHSLPSTVSFAQGAALGVPYATAYFALFIRGQAKPGETVLVHGGSGGVGTAVIQMARAYGLQIIATAGTSKGQDLVKKEGAHHVLDHHATDFTVQVMKLAGGRGVPLIIEMLANVNLANDLKLLSPRGRVVIVGNRGKVEIDPRDTMGRNADIRGMSLLFATPEELVTIHAAIVAGLENGSLRPIIGKEIPLAEASRAQQEVLAPGAHGKIVLVP